MKSDDEHAIHFLQFFAGPVANERSFVSTNGIYKAVLRASAGKCGQRQAHLLHLDIGAGRGELIRLLQKAYRCNSSACDYHVERFGLKDVPIVAVNLDLQPLPYENDSFDLVTCSEVVEHLENYRSALREAYRVLRPGGSIIVTTPNVLNVYSRVRYLVCGFANLFGPLPTRNDKLYSTGGHITPIPYFYLAHALTDAGFIDICLEGDKIQRTSVFWLLLFFPQPPLHLAAVRVLRLGDAGVRAQAQPHRRCQERCGRHQAAGGSAAQSLA